MGAQQSRASLRVEATNLISRSKQDNVDGWTNRCRNKPIDVSDVEDLTVDTSNFRIAALELDGNRSISQVGCHCEISNGCDESDRGSDVVEDTVATRNSEAQSYESKCRRSHDGGDSPIPIRPMGSDVDFRRCRIVKGIGVRAQRVIGSLRNTRHLD